VLAECGVLAPAVMKICAMSACLGFPPSMLTTDRDRGMHLASAFVHTESTE
jgi:hypothetical protein